jgi:L-asparaginase
MLSEISHEVVTGEVIIERVEIVGIQTKPRIAVIGTGGTIQSQGVDRLDLYNYGRVKPSLKIEEMIDQLPEANVFADLVLDAVHVGSSTDMTATSWLQIVSKIHEIAAAEPSVDGIVLTHGTATLEETAYFLNLVLKVDVPVVLVGAQRPFTALSSDGGMNVYNAIRVAACPEARGLGVLVLLNDEIHPAREVSKTSTYRLETFRAPDLGMLGYADADEIVFYRHPVRRNMPNTEFDVNRVTDLPRVDVVYSHVGADGVVIDALVNAGAKGLVIAGLAPNGATREQREAITAARERGVIVVQSCRAGSGRVIPSERLDDIDVIAADNLNPQKARILLMLALTQTANKDDITRIFREY